MRLLPLSEAYALAVLKKVVTYCKAVAAESHDFGYAPLGVDDFEEWLKDEATRLNIFGDKLVIEVMKAHERMAKEEKEKDKKEKKEG